MEVGSAVIACSSSVYWFLAREKCASGSCVGGAFGVAAATDLLDATLFQELEKPAVAATDLLNTMFFQGMGKPAAATSLLNALGSAAIVPQNNEHFLNSSCMTSLSAAGAANSFDFKGEESAKSHGVPWALFGWGITFLIPWENAMQLIKLLVFCKFSSGFWKDHAS